MKQKKLSLIGIIQFSLIAIGCSSMGSYPSKQKLEILKKSKQFNVQKGIFENRQAGLIAKMQKRIYGWSIIKEWFKTRIDGYPSQKLPEIKPDMKAFLAPSTDLKVIWFGHSSFLLNMDGTIVLVDPVFSGSAAPVSFAVERFQKPVLPISELPSIDYVLISHDHYDHLDMESIQYFVDKDVTFITPLGVGSHLTGWGIKESNIHEKDWWKSFAGDNIEFIATPAQHFSGRGLNDGNSTLWASWVIKSKNHNIYFSGDSGYDVHFKEIGDRLGPFEVAFLESGQYDKRWREVHMLPEEAVNAFKDLKAERYFPVHWGMFRLAFHTWYDPIDQLFTFSKTVGFDLIAPKLGQIVAINRDYKLETWWHEVPIGTKKQALIFDASRERAH